MQGSPRKKRNAVLIKKKKKKGQCAQAILEIHCKLIIGEPCLEDGKELNEDKVTERAAGL